MRHSISITTLAAFALLAACASEGVDDGSGTPDQAEPTPDPEAPVSILRPDVEQPEQLEPPKLEPLNTAIGFPDGGAELDEAAIEALKEVIKARQLITGAPIVLRGHSDAGGNDDANMRASNARAETVRDWLIDQGVDGDRITIVAFGEQNPVEPNALPNGKPNEEGRAANRRVEVLIVPLPNDGELSAPAPNAQTEDEASEGEASGAVGD